ncbi:unnamed protein product [Linum tenue]|uniref:Uncharacterized protein n=1 Tax=Linum tenue TaxID=586396 RepID=A0AAV0GTG8_9ROSI|nr:unnamed protein product [Linum tenue]
MPRPGPRPYECVRRAWHSDRHQSMRGSIIQQIFRVVSETHSAATRKNKEWQEKLPIVVLKAEEIMYSKANSEAEYMSHETLWDRVNDAINTIIRRDESSESGKLLPPCVEAALNLGCIPVRASRSQRHTNQRSYLTPRVQEPPPPSSPVPARTLNDAHAERCPQLPPFHSGNQYTRAPATLDSSPLPAFERNSQRAGAPSHACSLPFDGVPLGNVYPLYYGDHYQYKEPQFVSQVPERAASNPIYVGKPIGTAAAVDPAAEMGALQNFFSPGLEIASPRTTLPVYEQRAGAHCDLSLKLGFSSDPCMTMERSSGHGGNNGRFNDPSPANNQEFSFFPASSSHGPFEFPAMKGDPSTDASTIREPRAHFSDNVGEDGQYSCWPPGFPTNRFVG